MYESNVYTVLLNDMVTNKGQTLAELSKQQVILLVFLRHFGCVFCKEALHDLSEKRLELESLGVKIVFVHMAKNDIAEKYFTDYKLSGSDHISDPHARYYSEFGLSKGKISQLYGLQTWIKGFDARNKGFKLELARSLGDSTQMPGVFVIHEKKIKNQYIHKLASDSPNYMDLVQCCVEI